ncbi:MAG: hypothetical protein WD066_12290 [Planctomycetaceae bacterium]
MTSPTLLHGVIYGNTIRLDQAPGIPDGQSVTVIVEPIEAQQLPPGEGIRSAGAWADDAVGMDEWQEEMRRSRQDDRPEFA